MSHEDLVRELDESLKHAPIGQTERRIVQISAVPENAEYYGMIYALCNDGTVWGILEGGAHWDDLPAIPQPEPAQKPL